MTFVATYKKCGCSLVGQSHEAKGVKCQDSSFVDERNGVVVAIVADGLSSSLHSDIASKIAVKTVSEFCLSRISLTTDGQTILSVLQEAFDEALFQTKQFAKTNQRELKDFDTTLSAAVFIMGSVYSGQVGDSGILALREDGFFEQVTLPQNGEGVGKDRPTYTLHHVDRWKFQQYPQRVKALFLSTDGVLNKLMPPILEEQQYQFDNRYLFYLYSQLNSNFTYGLDDNWIKSEVSAIAPNECNHDDKSLLIVISDDVKLTKQSDAYYSYPDDKLWSKLQDELDRKLYPYRYAQEPENSLPPQTPAPSSTTTEESQQPIPNPVLFQDSDVLPHRTNQPNTKNVMPPISELISQGNNRAIPHGDKKSPTVATRISQTQHPDQYQQAGRNAAGKQNSRVSNANNKKKKTKKKLVFYAMVSLLCIAILIVGGSALKKMLFPVNQDDFSTAVDAAVNDVKTSFIYDSNPHGIEITMSEKYKNAVVKYGNSEDNCIENKSPTITNVKDSSLDVYIVVSCKGYDDVKRKVTLEMSAFNFKDMDDTNVPQQTYCANELRPIINVSIGGNSLESDKDYTTTYENNVEVGTATIVITSNETDGNHYGKKTVQFTINKADPQISIAKMYTIDIDNPDFQFPNQNTAVGVNGVSINGTLAWFTSEAFSTKAISKDLPRKAGEKVTLYYQFTPSNHSQSNYTIVSGSAEFVAVGENDSSANNNQSESPSSSENQSTTANKQEGKPSSAEHQNGGGEAN